jgi:hypothetical protein
MTKIYLWRVTIGKLGKEMFPDRQDTRQGVPDIKALYRSSGTRYRANRHYTWTPPKVGKTAPAYRVKVEGYNKQKVLVGTVKSSKSFSVVK